MRDLLSIKWPDWIAALLMIAGCWYLGSQVQQHAFHFIAIGFGLLFILYAVLLWKVKGAEQVLFFMIAAMLCRFSLLCSLPQLSDDYFRFIWDGRLTIQGIHPFAALPSQYAEQGFPLPGLDAALYEKLNSPQYFTIYPPVAQAIFAVACYAFPNSVEGSVWVMKCLLLLMEAGSVWLLWRLLRRFEMPVNNVLIYALNPLVIVEISGNLHFEGVMVFFFLLALWWGAQSKLGLSAGAMALSVASKMVSLLALPFLLRKLAIGRVLLYYIVFGLFVSVLFIPLLNDLFISNLSNSLNLYFRQFEFNAGLYYLARWIGYLKTGHNQIDFIGPILAAAAGVLILLQALFSRETSWAKLPQSALFATCTYLLFTTTVHPWYLCFPVVLSVFTRYRFAILWSALVVWSYHKYQVPGQPENLWITGVEYAAVLALLAWELIRGFISRRNR